MQITQFNINSQRTQLELTITDAATVSSLYLFINNAYKDYNQAIDLSSKLSGVTEENIIITLQDINSPFFDGLYFIEAEDEDEISSAITSDLTRYKECVLEKLLILSACDDCLKKQSSQVINAHMMIISLEDAVTEGFVNEAFNIQGALDKYCSNSCKSCGGYNNVIDNNYLETEEE